jgi:hypothetical protein
VEPPFRQPYLISLCFERPSTSSMGDFKRLVVRKAAKLAVYEEIMIRAKNHHTPVRMRALHDLGFKSIPERRLLFKRIKSHE